MTKVTLCWTSADGGYDWMEKTVALDEINFEGLIREYWSETKIRANALSRKWESDGNPDPLYLNFRMDKPNPMLFWLIDGYMESLD
jgi:hypothetical protein